MAKRKSKKGKKGKRPPIDQPPPNRKNSILQTVAAWLTVIGFVIALGMYVLSLLPKVGISAASSLNPSDPFATPFVIKNDGPLSINSVNFYCALYEFNFGGAIFRRYPHDKGDALFTDETPATPQIKANQSTTIVCNFREMFRSHGPMTTGDLAIVVSFRPAFVFWPSEQRQRFITAKSKDGILYWHPKVD